MRSPNGSERLLIVGSVAWACVIAGAAMTTTFDGSFSAVNSKPSSPDPDELAHRLGGTVTPIGGDVTALVNAQSSARESTQHSTATTVYARTRRLLLLAWVIPVMLIYGFGWSVVWIRRGFRR
jgi:hypothetical protein